VLIPAKVYEETVIAGKKKQLPDAIIIDELIHKKKIEVIKIKNKSELDRIYQFNVFGGEAESVALYFPEKAGILVSDDDNLRKKKAQLRHLSRGRHNNDCFKYDQ
jgi:predicted nucleic acid-binding protein